MLSSTILHHTLTSIILNLSGQLSSEAIKSIARQRRNELFDKEAKRQIEKIGRIEKITVNYIGVPKDEAFVMNSGISTPYNVAQRK